jgi:hypothetical protein
MPVDPEAIAKAVKAKMNKAIADEISQYDKHTETGDRAPDELGTVKGWRAWRIEREPDKDGQVWLHSVSRGYVWVPFEKARASCANCESMDPLDSDCTPGDKCGCGFYTARTLPHLRSMGYHSYNAQANGPVTIVGKVANWGKVIPGTQGWRAEYAYPETLYVPFEVARVIARPLANTYGVPVVLMNLLDPDAKPGRLRDPRRVVAPYNQEPKFLVDWKRAHKMPGFEDLDDDE